MNYCKNYQQFTPQQQQIQSFSELEIDAMCCVWPDERGYLYIYRCCGASGGGGGGGGSMMGIDMCKAYYAWISQQ